jgi:hypothetical protein
VGDVLSPWAVMFWTGAAIGVIFALAMYAATKLP